MLTLPNGDTYFGSFANGKCHGQGVMKYSDGREYSGEWQADHWCGTGTVKLANGSVYLGECVDSQMSGKGEQFFLLELHVVRGACCAC